MLTRPPLSSPWLAIVTALLFVTLTTAQGTTSSSSSSLLPSSASIPPSASASASLSASASITSNSTLSTNATSSAAATVAPSSSSSPIPTVIATTPAQFTASITAYIPGQSNSAGIAVGPNDNYIAAGTALIPSSFGGVMGVTSVAVGFVLAGWTVL